MKSVTVLPVHKPSDSSHGHVPIHFRHKASNITISRQFLIQKYPKQELVLERQALVRGLVGCTEGGVVASRAPASVALGVKVPVLRPITRRGLPVQPIADTCSKERQCGQ